MNKYPCKITYGRKVIPFDLAINNIYTIPVRKLPQIVDGNI